MDRERGTVIDREREQKAVVVAQGFPVFIVRALLIRRLTARF